MRDHKAAETAIRWVVVVGLMCMLSGDALHAQQVADPHFTPRVPSPAFPHGQGPRVLVDAAHQNFHTLMDRYAPFGDILAADGYRVVSSHERLDPGALVDVAILVIANAGTAGKASWRLPTAPALDAEEIETVVVWVRDGGSLFLIADHMPAAGAVAELAARFGVYLTNGYTYAPRRGHPGDLFTRADGKLLDHPITNGRDVSERVDSVLSFTGQAFQVVSGPGTVLRYGPDAFSYLPVDAEATPDETTPRVASPGWVHGTAFEVEEGRVAVFGEAAMFSAQLAGAQRRPMGLNHALARGNQQLLLNIVHWLCGLIGDSGSPG
jgi:hypothetical protein